MSVTNGFTAMLTPSEIKVYFKKKDPGDFSQHFYAILFYQ